MPDSIVRTVYAHQLVAGDIVHHKGDRYNVTRVAKAWPSQVDDDTVRIDMWRLASGGTRWNVQLLARPDLKVRIS